jgi:hypothetical protein
MPAQPTAAVVPDAGSAAVSNTVPGPQESTPVPEAIVQQPNSSVDEGQKTDGDVVMSSATSSTDRAVSLTLRILVIFGR